ncbi:MAG: hypothetical protein EKK64_01530 [Neisseriaceae bacterium]|nr:MAG: hypothetical protein EKK64_01530 [Neisseriaceae bacterium]
MAVASVLCVMVTEYGKFGSVADTERNLKFLSARFGQTITKDNLYEVLDVQAQNFNCSIVDFEIGDPVEYIKTTNTPDQYGQDIYDKFVAQAEQFWLEQYEGHAYSMYEVTYEYDQIIMIILDDDNMSELDMYDDPAPCSVMC